MAKLSRRALEARAEENGEKADRLAAWAREHEEVAALQAISPALPGDHREKEERAPVLVNGRGHPASCGCQRCLVTAERERGPLRKITKILDRSTAFGKGSVALLECGHYGEQRGSSPRARCHVCRDSAAAPRAASAAKAKAGPLRPIVRVLRKQQGSSKPAVVLLSCGHEGTSWRDIAARARCPTCEKAGQP